MTGNPNGTSTYLSNQEAERAIIGSILVDRDVIIAVAPLLKPADFTDKELSSIYGVMLELYNRRVPADFITIMDRLGDKSSLLTLEHLYETHFTSVHAEYYAGIVRECSQYRQLVSAGEWITESAVNQDSSPAELSAQAADMLARAQESSDYQRFQSATDLASIAYERYEQGTEPVIKTGFIDIDNTLGGFKPGQLIIPAARPSVGKSSIQVQMMYQQAKAGHRVGLITLEMTSDELFDRIVAMHAGVDMNAYRSSPNVPQQVHEKVITAVGQVAEMPFFIDGRGNGTLSDTVARARLLHTTEQIEVLYVDYLQLVTADGKENRTQEVSTISRGLKRLARQLNIPVVAASQLSRNSEHREPLLSDLRESGSIEQDADIVFFLHRPDLYDDNAPPNVTKILVAKHRNGPTGYCRLVWRPETAQFGNYQGGVTV